MEVRRIEQEDGTLTALEFVGGNEPDFKAAVKTWIQANTNMNWQEFYDRLAEYRVNKLRLSML